MADCAIVARRSSGQTRTFSECCERENQREFHDASNDNQEGDKSDMGHLILDHGAADDGHRPASHALPRLLSGEHNADRLTVDGLVYLGNHLAESRLKLDRPHPSLFFL